MVTAKQILGAMENTIEAMKPAIMTARKAEDFAREEWHAIKGMEQAAKERLDEAMRERYALQKPHDEACAIYQGMVAEMVNKGN
jgi:hypothetical protein